MISLSLYMSFIFFFFNDTATTEIYTLSLHDALPIFRRQFKSTSANAGSSGMPALEYLVLTSLTTPVTMPRRTRRSEEHTSELQSRLHLVCRLLLEKKKKHNPTQTQHL